MSPCNLFFIFVLEFARYSSRIFILAFQGVYSLLLVDTVEVGGSDRRGTFGVVLGSGSCSDEPGTSPLGVIGSGPGWGTSPLVLGSGV